MKKIIVLLTVFAIVFSFTLPVLAAEGNVIYNGEAKKFIFEPGSEHSLTDLFPNFKGVMPGDTISQKITVRNDASNEVKVRIYMRSLGAHANSVDFLSKLNLRVEKSIGDEMSYMFDATADESAQLTEWTYLGMLYSGGEVDLDVFLDVPVELSNEYMNEIGFLDWEFMIEEFPVEEGDPQAPQTGDSGCHILWFIIPLAAASIIFILIYALKKKREEEGA